MKAIALTLALMIAAATPAMAKTKKPAQPVQTDPQHMTFDEAMAVNKKNLSLVVEGLPLVLPSWSLPIFFGLKMDEKLKAGDKKTEKKKAENK